MGKRMSDEGEAKKEDKSSERQTNTKTDIINNEERKIMTEYASQPERNVLRQYSNTTVTCRSSWRKLWPLQRRASWRRSQRRWARMPSSDWLSVSVYPQALQGPLYFVCYSTSEQLTLSTSSYVLTDLYPPRSTSWQNSVLVSSCYKATASKNKHPSPL